jgi:hypothetical protein
VTFEGVRLVRSLRRHPRIVPLKDPTVCFSRASQLPRWRVKSVTHSVIME